MQRSDGAGGDADYERIGRGYARYRQPEPAFAAIIHSALGNSRSILNVGAGAGSYEPSDRLVTAVEPSASMRAERQPHRVAALDAVAEALPFDDDSFDAAMALSTIHQWRDLELGLREMRRVTRGPIVLLTSDPERLGAWWLDEYAPEATAIEAARFPAIGRICDATGDRASVRPLPIPLLCRDGFNEAYYGRPEKLLDPEARLACSSWSFVSSESVERFENHLRADLDSGVWDARYGHLRRQPSFDGSLRLIVC
jgi:SAM-dependent methyltransferase